MKDLWEDVQAKVPQPVCLDGNIPIPGGVCLCLVMELYTPHSQQLIVVVVVILF